MGKRQNHHSACARSAALAAKAANDEAAAIAIAAAPTIDGVPLSSFDRGGGRVRGSGNGNGGVVGGGGAHRASEADHRLRGRRRDQREKNEGEEDRPRCDVVNADTKKNAAAPNATRRHARLVVKLAVVFCAGRFGRSIFLAASSGRITAAMNGGGGGIFDRGEAIAAAIGGIFESVCLNETLTLSTLPSLLSSRVRAPSDVGGGISGGSVDCNDGRTSPFPPPESGGVNGGRSEAPFLRAVWNEAGGGGSGNVGEAFGSDDGAPPPPSSLAAPYGSYPNPWNITDDMRGSFHPVVRFPKKKRSRSKEKRGGRSGPSSSRSRGRGGWWRWLWGRAAKTYDYSVLPSSTESSDDGCVRTGVELGGPAGTKVHAFADGAVLWAGRLLPPPPNNGDGNRDGGVGCCQGGGVNEWAVVVEHDLGTIDDTGGAEKRKVWALYGGLDARSVARHGAQLKKARTKRIKRKRKVRRGEVLGRMADVVVVGGRGGGIAEAKRCNGGGRNERTVTTPRLHFVLSVEEPSVTAITPPTTTTGPLGNTDGSSGNAAEEAGGDAGGETRGVASASTTTTTMPLPCAAVRMPGAVPAKDRAEALRLYPDPRLVLGELY